MDLTQRILSYNFEADELDEVAELASADELFAVLNQLLQSSNADEVGITLGFIRDFMIMDVSQERQRIRDQYPESSLVKTIEKLLFCPNHFTRHQAGYTLGKTCSYGSVDAITQAVHHFRDTDPIFLKWLMGELHWLGGESFGDCVIFMAESPVYATRWASIPMLCGFIDESNSELYQFRLERFERLRNDPNLWVRQEAEYEYQEQVISRELYILDKALIREQRKILREQRRTLSNKMKRLHQQRKSLSEQRFQYSRREYEPAITFFAVQSAFCYHLSQQKAIDYSIGELEAFIDKYVATKGQEADAI